MIAWLWNLIVGRFCAHTWQTVERLKLVDDDRVCIGRVVFARCTKCGRHTSWSLKA